MILLTSTADLIQVVTGSASSIKVHASWVDDLAAGYTPGRTNTPAITTATTTTVVPSPALSTTQRGVKYLSIYNAGIAQVVTVQHTDGTTAVPLQNGITLGAGFTLAYEAGASWKLYDASANLQQSVGPGRFLKRTVITSGTTFTTGTGTNSIVARLQGSGGQGGGGAAVAGECGSGGGSGAYAEWSTPVSPSTVYTCAIGAGGSTGGTGANGQAGTSTTLAVGGTTCTAPGGSGGLVGTSASIGVLGGAGGTVATSGTLNTTGNPGEPNYCTGTAADNRSGQGGDSLFGNGGAPLFEASATTGNAGGGYGAGGGGASTTGTATKGGAGSPGVIIVDEYS